MRGRKPDPTVVKLLNQSQNLRTDIDDEPHPPGVLLAPPDYMTPEQIAIWDAAIDGAPKGLLRKLDARLLSIWVIAAHLHEEAAKQVEKFGMIVKSPKQGIPMQSPYMPIINRQAEIMLRTASELGFSPTSRSRITLAGGGSKTTNKFSNNAARKHA